MYRIEAMTWDHAEQIAAWQYPGVYSIYRFTPSAETMSELMNGEYVACTNAQGDLIGYFCFGASARIPTVAGYASDVGAVDIGLGLSPELCGQGHGKAFLESGMLYAKQRWNPSALRLVVAAWNKRAMTLYQNCGFVSVDRVEHQKSRADFIVMQCTL